MMIRSTILAAALATGLAVPAFAADQPANADASANSAAVAAYTASLSNAANANEARKFLTAKGYSQISELNRDENGRWSGTAVKNGQNVGVAVDISPKQMPAATN